MTAPSPDPRVGLKAGWFDAGEAIWNLQVVSKTPPSKDFINPTTPGDRRLVNSDLAFMGNYVIQGNYSGMQIWDISNPSKPVLRTAYVCPGSQSDVSVYGHLLFVSAEATNGRIDCGLEGVKDTASADRARGIRIYDIADIEHPKSVKVVQTCRGSHTNTLVTDPHDPANVYIYVSGSANVRPSEELAGCSGGQLGDDPSTALFRIEVIQVPVDHPEDARIVSSPRIFHDLVAATRHGESSADSATQAAALARMGIPPGTLRRWAGMGPTQCHDITAYPAIGLAGGACSGYGLLLDIRQPRPAGPDQRGRRHEHGGLALRDIQQRRVDDHLLRRVGRRRAAALPGDATSMNGAPTRSTAQQRQMTFQSYYKMSAPQTSFENCVAHNGSLIPIPGRDIMVQAWYQGGISVFEFTDPAHPHEIAFFDRGPMDSTKLVDGGYWSAYWYNGYIVGSEISRGLDLFQLKASGLISQNEIDAAKLVHMDQENVQGQPQFVWPTSFVVARAYVDQLVRDHGLAPEETTRITQGLARAERLSGDQRTAALTELAGQLDTDMQNAGDPGKVKLLASEVRALANPQT